MIYRIINTSDDILTFYDSLGVGHVLRKGVEVTCDRLPENRIGLIAYKLDDKGGVIGRVDISLENALEKKRLLQEEIKQIRAIEEANKKQLAERSIVQEKRRKDELKIVEKQRIEKERLDKIEEIRLKNVAKELETVKKEIVDLQEEVNNK